MLAIGFQEKGLFFNNEQLSVLESEANKRGFL
jgi:hypothetical protein